MESECSIDAQFANEISALLKRPSSLQVQEYYDQLLRTRQCSGIKVKQDGEFGKCICADMEFGEGNLILKDQMLVGSQHSSNKIDCLVCSFCFKFIGSIELQIGRRLYLQYVGAYANKECDGKTFAHDSIDCFDSSSGDSDSYDLKIEESTSNKKMKLSLPRGIIESLMNGELLLPHSKRFSMPSAIPCHGGCGEAYYCSESCAVADWEISHSLLCTGKRSESLCKDALSKFVQHANETNDIFLLAAKAMSFTILKYQKLRKAQLQNQQKDSKIEYSKSAHLDLLLEAWKPIAMGHKRRWWDCISLPDDVDLRDEAAFRMEIRDMALASLNLLKAAIFDKECEPLFCLEIYGHLIGMFELNNLDLVVASPVEDYFLYIDDLPDDEKKEAEEITRPFLDALGEGYSVCCQGTGFFPLQSCMNHSCCPNAKAFKREEDRDGQAVIVALQSICKGEEVTISYIDEDLPYEERQSLLADYGFSCRCAKCLKEGP